MRIAQVAPLYESVPPRCYGGTERVVSYLTEELIRQGHEVTLFASGDSQTKARLCAPCSRSLRQDETCKEPIAYHVLMLERVYQEASNFDLVHFHADYLPLPLARRLSAPCVHTMHGRLDNPELTPLFQEFREAPLVSISHAQRAPLTWANWMGTVYHGLPRNLYTYNDTAGDYVVFLGRVSVEKQVHIAIEMARKAGVRLKIAAKVDRRDQGYYEEMVRPLLKAPGVDFLGEIGGRDKDRLLGGARALLLPIDWPEPFGLVMIEALACGTPVIAYRRGSVPEILDDGTTGYIVDNVDDGARAIRAVNRLNRRHCRRAFEQRFSVGRMTSDYLALYQQLVLGARPAVAIGYE
jgi:glycosyltransferase involved in cell wall biosynthesis